MHRRGGKCLMPRPVHFGRVGIIPLDNTTVLSHIMVAGQTLIRPMPLKSIDTDWSNLATINIDALCQPMDGSFTKGTPLRHLRIRCALLRSGPRFNPHQSQRITTAYDI